MRRRTGRDTAAFAFLISTEAPLHVMSLFPAVNCIVSYAMKVLPVESWLAHTHTHTFSWPYWLLVCESRVNSRMMRVREEGEARKRVAANDIDDNDVLNIRKYNYIRYTYIVQTHDEGPSAQVHIDRVRTWKGFLCRCDHRHKLLLCLTRRSGGVNFITCKTLVGGGCCWWRLAPPGASNQERKKSEYARAHAYGYLKCLRLDLHIEMLWRWMVVRDTDWHSAVVACDA